MLQYVSPMKNLRYSAIFFLMTLFGVLQSYSVPAKPGLTRYEQPNGEYVDVIIHGDESGHYLTSSDGYILSENNDALYFSERNPVSGRLQAGPMLATNPVARDFKTADYLKKLNKAELLQISRAQLSAARKANGRKYQVTDENVGQFGLFPGSAFPLFGEQRGLVILVEFSDVAFNEGYDAADYFSRMLNEEGFSDQGGTGSAREYFIENSRGMFRPEFDVYGPVVLNKPMAYYGGNDKNGQDKNPAAMIVEACMKLDPEVDFSQYDRDDDDNIDNVFVFYAGKGEASGGLPSSIWPHSWDVRSASEAIIRLDGKVLGKYACTNEWQGQSPDGIGTFVHEFSHVLGLPDLYATSYTEAFTPGQWSVMDQGSYNNSSRTPPMYSGFERYALGWSDAPELTGKRNIAMRSIIHDDGYVLSTADESERYFIEYREKEGWDSYLPGTGMLLWHVNYADKIWTQNIVNNDPSRQYVDLIEAGGKKDKNSRAYHSFPGVGGVYKLSEDTHPDVVAWKDKSFFLNVSKITEQDGVLSATVNTTGSSIAIPEKLTVSDISTNAFTATWSGVNDADDYIISVYAKKEGGSNSLKNGFDDGLKNMHGWSTSALVLSYAENNVGESSPSLTFYQNGGSLDSPLINESITTFSFWSKAFSENVPIMNPEITIYVKKGVENNWEEFAVYEPKLNANGKRVTYDNLPDGVKAVRLRVTGINGVIYYVDDCEIEYGMKSVHELLPGYPKNVGNVHSVRIDGLPAGLTGAVSIIATDGENVSDESAKVSFQLKNRDDSGMESILTDETEAEYFTLEGLKVSNPVKGVYICRRGTKISKVIF